MRKRTPEARFWEKVDKTDSCWLWVAYCDPDGYGRLGQSDQTSDLAHRFAYELLVGPIPGGFDVDHLCRNRACVNPDHLEAVTHVDNVRRAVKARWAKQTHCPSGHRFTEANTYFRTDYAGRKCRACNREAVRRYTERQKTG